MSQFENYDKYFPLPTSTTERPWYVNPKPEHEEIEYDDTAPLPLLIGIGLTLLIGFIILILICCCCRVRRPRPDASQTNYQRAPIADRVSGGGGGVAYPLTTLPTESGFGTPPVSYQPPQAPMTSLVKMDYGMIGSGPGQTLGTGGIHQVPQTQIKQQPPHFGGVPTFQQAQYVATSYAPGFYPGQGPGVAFHHSSQASSSASEAASDNMRNLGQPRFPHQPSQQTAVPGGQSFQYQMVPQQAFHPMMPPPHLSQHQLVQHQQQLQQQQQQMYVSGRNTPAVMMHPDRQLTPGVGVNYTGNININNQNQQVMSSAQHPYQVPSAPQPSLDVGDSIPPATLNHPTTSTPISVNTGATDFPSGAASQQISREGNPLSANTSPSSKPLLTAESGHPPSVSSNSEGEEEE